jgi:hypothetical protein
LLVTADIIIKRYPQSYRLKRTSMDEDGVLKIGAGLSGRQSGKDSRLKEFREDELYDY